MSQTLALDWDDTLVGRASKQWQPEALRALKLLLRSGNTVIVHSCRLGWPQGRDEIVAKLREERLAHLVRLEPKPYADFYVDDKARLPDWPALLREVNAGRSRLP
jgi:hypothetical protein